MSQHLRNQASALLPFRNAQMHFSRRLLLGRSIGEKTKGDALTRRKLSIVQHLKDPSQCYQAFQDP
ncbi:hypothetical protein BCON_0017g00230 [Botryotinia convoluta]|uniref:Uncharacterized protein n=1 Tax=Botryotinia convoluta TaxID=54673 RepID=A0A4Z1ITD9_9HELO|nr:hypothetical protein BCON_0017g00230 [Botryotinia convoluta]